MEKVDNKSVHTGHRKRMLETYLSAGADGFSDVQLLEFLLSYSIARKDTNPIAHRLLEEYGDLARIMEIPIKQLMNTCGIGERTAALLHFVGDYYLRARRSHEENTQRFDDARKIGNYLVTWFGALREEHAVVMCLDANCRLLDCREVSSGSVNSLNLPYRKVVELALLNNATSVIIAHNHTNDSTLPSREDVIFTEGLRDALHLFNIILADHYVINGDSYFSMAASKMI